MENREKRTPKKKSCTERNTGAIVHPNKTMVTNTPDVNQHNESHSYLNSEKNHKLPSAALSVDPMPSVGHVDSERADSQQPESNQPHFLTPNKKRSFTALSPSDDSEITTKIKRSNDKSPQSEINYENPDDAFDNIPIPSGQASQASLCPSDENDMEAIVDIDSDYVDEHTANHLGKKVMKKVRMVPTNTPSHYGSRLANQQFNHAPRNYPKRDQKRQHVQYPIILEETEQGVPYDSLAPHHLNLWKSKGIIIKTQYRLRKGKWLISCENQSAQKNAEKCTNLSGSTFKCHIPKNTTKGVIGPFNVNINLDEVKKSMQKEKKVTDIQRIYKDKCPTAMLKVFFESETLPKEIRVGAEIFQVQPFRRTIIRCSNCQALGHRKTDCRAKSPVCAGCGMTPHDKDPKINSMMCKKKKCINCSGPHSAAYKGCPEVFLHTRASEINSLFGISEADAMVVLRKMTHEKIKQDIRKFQRSEFVSKRREHTPSNAHYQLSPPRLGGAAHDESITSLWPEPSHNQLPTSEGGAASRSQNLSQQASSSNILDGAAESLPPTPKKLPLASTETCIKYKEPTTSISELFQTISSLQKQVEILDKRTRTLDNKDTHDHMNHQNSGQSFTKDAKSSKKDESKDVEKLSTPQNVSLNDIFIMVPQLQDKIQTIDQRTQKPIESNELK